MSFSARHWSQSETLVQNKTGADPKVYAGFALCLEPEL
jgi:hypothetical protein